MDRGSKDKTRRQKTSRGGRVHLISPLKHAMHLSTHCLAALCVWCVCVCVWFCVCVVWEEGEWCGSGWRGRYSWERESVRCGEKRCEKEWDWVG